MYCKKCGREISEDARYCPNCGADQHGSNDNIDVYGWSLKIFAVICALLYLITAFESASYAFRNLFDLFDHFFTSFVFAALYVLGAVARLWLVLMLVLMAFRRDRQNTPALTFGVAVGGVAVAVLKMIRAVFILVFFQIFDSTLSSSLLGVVICVGGVYALLHLMGQAPTPESLLQDPAESFSDLLAFINDIFGKGGTNEATYDTDRDHTSDYDDHDYEVPNDYDTHDGHGTFDDYGTPGGHDTNGFGQPVKTDRSLVAYILLSIITCGLYSWYFIYCLARDVNIMCRQDGQKTSGLLVWILLNIITCGFYNLYWMYNLGNRLAANSRRYGLHFQENGTTVLLWYLVGLFMCGIGPYVAMHFLIKNSNALGTAYNRSIGH